MRICCGGAPLAYSSTLEPSSSIACARHGNGESSEGRLYKPGQVDNLAPRPESLILRSTVCTALSDSEVVLETCFAQREIMAQEHLQPISDVLGHVSLTRV